MATSEMAALLVRVPFGATSSFPKQPDPDERRERGRDRLARCPALRGAMRDPATARDRLGAPPWRGSSSLRREVSIRNSRDAAPSETEAIAQG